MRTYLWLILMVFAAPRLASAELVWALSLDNRLVVFAPEAPGTILREVQITGLEPGETMRAIDFRPLDSQLYGYGSSHRIYRIHMLTGAATAISASVLEVRVDDDDELGFDFNPVTDEIRIVSSASQNFRVSPSTGQVIDGSSTLIGIQGDSDLAPASEYVAAAHSNNYPGAAATTLVAITSSTDRFVCIGGIGGSPSPNLGAVTDLGPLGIATDAHAALDITLDNQPYAFLSRGGFCLINRTNGHATEIDAIGTLGANVADIAVLSVASTVNVVTEDRRLLRFKRYSPSTILSDAAGDVANHAARRRDSRARRCVCLDDRLVDRRAAAGGRTHHALGRERLRSAHREGDERSGAPVVLRGRRAGILLDLRAARESADDGERGDGRLSARRPATGDPHVRSGAAVTPDGRCRRGYGAAEYVVWHGGEVRAAGRCRARDVLRRVAVVEGRARIGRGHAAGAGMVPRGRRDRAVLRNVHPAGQSGSGRHGRRDRHLSAGGGIAAHHQAEDDRAGEPHHDQRGTGRYGAGQRRVWHARVLVAAIVVERAQYWPDPAPAWYEAHNSFGTTAAGTKWGLAEGRVGGPSNYQTYILLANPSSADAEVTITFLRTNETTVTKTVTVAGLSRLNVAPGPGSPLVPELADEEFGAVITSTQPIVVERAMYLDAAGVVWSAGTNATATRLP